MSASKRMLRATRISRWVLERAAGDMAPGSVRSELGATVASVHERAVNLRLDSGDLLCVSAIELPLAPDGVAVELDRAARFPDLGLRVGQRARLDPDALRVTDAKLGVSFAGATGWEPRPVTGRVAPRDLARRASEARTIVIAEAPAASLMPLLWAGARPGMPGGLARVAAGPAAALRQAATAGDAAGVAGAARALAGLGPGLTPSGDDFLAGFAAAWALVPESLGPVQEAGGTVRPPTRSRPTPSAGAARPCAGTPDTRRDPGCRRARPEAPDGVPPPRCAQVRFQDVPDRILAPLCEGARAGASELGRAWLAHAVRGEVAEPLGRFIAAVTADTPELADVDGPGVGRPERSTLGGSVRAVLAIGATSGADWMAGALIAIASILDAAGTAGSPVVAETDSAEAQATAGARAGKIAASDEPAVALADEWTPWG